MKRKALFQKVRDLGGFNVKNLKERLIDYVKENVESSDFQVDHNFLARDIRLLLNKGKVKFQKHVRHYDTFFEKENRWLYLNDAGDLSERGRNASNLKSDGGGLFCPFFRKLGPWLC